MDNFINLFKYRYAILNETLGAKTRFIFFGIMVVWCKYLDSTAIIPYDVIIIGDLNKSDVEACRFSSILDSHGLTQHVITPQ